MLILLIVILVVLVTGILVNKNSQSTHGLTKVEGYVHLDDGDPACNAYSPGCGLCIGKVINKECYVDKDKLTPDELKFMGLN